jgi:hypothetical protein
MSIHLVSPWTSKCVLKRAELQGLRTLFDMAFTATNEEVAELALASLTELHTADFAVANAPAMMSLLSSSVNTCLQRLQTLRDSTATANPHMCQRVFAVFDMLIQPNIPGHRHGTQNGRAQISVC